LNDVIEHLHDPLKALIKVKAVLKKLGYTCIRTPNFNFIVQETYRSLHLPYWYEKYIERHLYFFTPRTLALISKKAGFKIVKLSFDNLSYGGTVQKLLLEQLLSKLLKRPFLGSLRVFEGKLWAFLKQGVNIELFARIE